MKMKSILSGLIAPCAICIFPAASYSQSPQVGITTRRAEALVVRNNSDDQDGTRIASFDHGPPRLRRSTCRDHRRDRTFSLPSRSSGWAAALGYFVRLKTSKISEASVPPAGSRG